MVSTTMGDYGNGSQAERAATRAVAGIGERIERSGGSKQQAQTVEKALKYFLLGEEVTARRLLMASFPADKVDEIVRGFHEGVYAYNRRRSMEAA